MNRPHLKVIVADAKYTCVLRIDGSASDLAAIDVALDLRGQHDHVNRKATHWRTAIKLKRWRYPMGEGGDGTCRRLTDRRHAYQTHGYSLCGPPGIR